VQVTESSSAERILKISLDLFSKKGYDATSVREICEGAEITKPTLYHFYGSKEGVYQALVEGALHDFRRGMIERLEISGSIEQRLKEMAWAYFGKAIRQQQLARFILGLIHNPPSSAPKTDFQRFYDQIVAALCRAIDEAVGRGELAPGPTNVRALVLMGALGEAVHGYLLVGQPDLTSALAEVLVDTVLRGWRH
jgi:TetR/AcrR family transcriptional regulator